MTRAYPPPESITAPSSIRRRPSSRVHSSPDTAPVQEISRKTECAPAAAAVATPKAAVRLQGLWKTYPGNTQPAVKDLSLNVHDGEIVTLLGPSGCGKTTTLRMVAGLEVPDAGEISFGERVVVVTARRFFLPPEKRNIGM